MRRFVAWQNIERYRRMLTTETDDARRQAIIKLLTEEEEIWTGLMDAEVSKVELNGQQTQAVPQLPKKYSGR